MKSSIPNVQHNIRQWFLSNISKDYTCKNAAICRKGRSVEMEAYLYNDHDISKLFAMHIMYGTLKCRPIIHPPVHGLFTESAWGHFYVQLPVNNFMVIIWAIDVNVCWSQWQHRYKVHFCQIE